MPDSNINNYCLICGKGYHVCHSCREMRTFTPWRTIADTSNCFSIYLTLSDYNGGSINKEQAREQLLRCDLTEKETFKERPRNTINEIMDETAKASRRRGKRSVVETTDTAEADTEHDDSAANCE